MSEIKYDTAKASAVVGSNDINSLSSNLVSVSIEGDVRVPFAYRDSDNSNHLVEVVKADKSWFVETSAKAIDKEVTIISEKPNSWIGLALVLQTLINEGVCVLISEAWVDKKSLLEPGSKFSNGINNWHHKAFKIDTRKLLVIQVRNEFFIIEPGVYESVIERLVG